MPVSAAPLITRLQLRVRLGFDEYGNPILRTRSYSNIKTTATHDALYDTAHELAGLQEYPLDVVRRVDEMELEEEEE